MIEGLKDSKQFLNELEIVMVQLLGLMVSRKTFVVVLVHLSPCIAMSAQICALLTREATFGTSACMTCQWAVNGPYVSPLPTCPLVSFCMNLSVYHFIPDFTG